MSDKMSIYETIAQRYNNCCSLQNFIPKNWSKEEVAKSATSTFVISFLALMILILSHRYPAASGAFLTLFSIGTIASLIVMIAACKKTNLLCLQS